MTDTCICGHPEADHQLFVWAYRPPSRLECDLCETCPEYVEDEALAAVEALETS